MKKIFILTALFAFSLTLFSQEKIEVKDKLKNLKGNVKEIIIKTDSDSLTIKDDEAEYIFAKLKNNKDIKLVISNGDNEEDVIYLNGRKLNISDNDSLLNSLKFKVNYINADSLLQSLKSNVRYFNADSLLKSLKFKVNYIETDSLIKSLNSKLKFLDTDSLVKSLKLKAKIINADSLLKAKNFQFDFELNDSGLVYKNILIKINNDKKKVMIIEKDKDGKEIEKIYEGEEAENKIKEMEKEDKAIDRKKKIVIEKNIIKKDK